MKKKITICALLLVIVAFSVSAYGKYMPRSVNHRCADGYYGAEYCGTTRELTIEKVDNDCFMYVMDASSIASSPYSKPQRFGGKLSKRQSNLLWNALDLYDYSAGEIYTVNFSEGTQMSSIYQVYNLTVKIEADGSCSWKGFSYSIDTKYL